MKEFNQLRITTEKNFAQAMIVGKEWKAVSNIGKKFCWRKQLLTAVPNFNNTNWTCK